MADWKVQAGAVVGIAALMTIAAVGFDGRLIETSIRERAQAALAPEVTSWATVAVHGRDVDLSGAAPTETLRVLAEDRVRRIFGVRSVGMDGVTLLPEAAPYVVRIVRDGGTLSIEGSAPSAPERRRMVDALTAAVPDVAYNDRLVLARGAPERGFAETLAALYPLLADIRRGEIVLSDTTVTIDGEAASNEAFTRLGTGPQTLPAGYSLGTVSLVRPRADPYSLTATIDPDGIALSGFAPDPQTRERLFAAARTAAGQGRVQDAVDLASGAPDGFADAVSGALDFARLLADGRIDVTSGRVTVSGVAADPAAWRTLNAHLAAWRPTGFTVEADVGLPIVTPYTLSAVRAGPKVTVTGFAPTDAVMEGLRAAAGKVAGLKGAVVETTLAAGEPEGYAPAAVFTIDLLSHLSTGTAALVDRTITVTGAAESGADLLELQARTASATPEGYTVSLSVTPPVVAPYSWTLEKTEDSLVVSGYVPSEEARTELREIVEESAGDLGVADRTQLAAGLPPSVDLAAVARFAVGSLAGLDSGSVSLEDAVLSVVGRTDDARAGALVVQAMETLPAGTTKGRVSVDAPPALRFHIERGLDAVTVEGTVADEAARDRVAETVRRAFGGIDVEMSLEPFPGLPAGAAEATVAAVRAASLLSEGVIDLEPGLLTVKGRAFTGVGATRVASDIAPGLPAGYRLDTSVSVARRGEPLAPAACADAVSGLLAANLIRFDTGADAIADDSHGFMDRVAATLQRCPDTRVRIEGAGDRPGEGPVLGKMRAAAVAAFLDTTGYGLDRITITGVDALPPASGPDAAARRVAITVEPAQP